MLAALFHVVLAIVCCHQFKFGVKESMAHFRNDFYLLFS